MEPAKKNVIFVALCSFVLPVLVFAVVYGVDPFQIYSIQRDVFPNDQRIRIASWAKNRVNEGDAIILGTSLSQNFVPSDVEKSLGWSRVHNFALSGGRLREQRVVLDCALDSGIKYVLWEMRVQSIVVDDNVNSWHPRHEMPTYLYTSSLVDDQAYLFSLSVFNDSIDILKKSSKYKEYDPEFHTYWMSKRMKRHVDFSKEKSLQDIKSNMKLKLRNYEYKYIKTDRPQYMELIYEVIKQHPDVMFYLFFPPRFKGRMLSANPGYINRCLSTQYDVVMMMSQLDNVKVFGFDDTGYIVENTANYGDVEHYHSGVSSLMLKMMNDGTAQLTESNVDQYILRIEKLLNDVSIYTDAKNMIPFAFSDEQEAMDNEFVGRGGKRALP